MQMNKHNCLVPIGLPVLVLLAAICVPTALAVEQNDPPPVTPPAVSAAEEVQQAPSEMQSAKKEQAEVTARPIKEFKPSETIGADSAVAFPIDI